MKKILSILLSLIILSTLFAACTNSKPTNEETKTTLTTALSENETSTALPSSIEEKVDNDSLETAVASSQNTSEKEDKTKTSKETTEKDKTEKNKAAKKSSVSVKLEQKKTDKKSSKKTKNGNKAKKYTSTETVKKDKSNSGTSKSGKKNTTSFVSTVQTTEFDVHTATKVRADSTTLSTSKPSSTQTTKSSTSATAKSTTVATTDKTVALSTTKPVSQTTTATSSSVTASISIECKSILDNMDNLAKGHESYVPSDGVILDEYTATYNKKTTAYDLLSDACKENNISVSSEKTSFGMYVSGINNLDEFDCGQQSGWTYYVNGKMPNVACSAYKLKNGDKVVFSYTCSYKK